MINNSQQTIRGYFPEMMESSNNFGKNKIMKMSNPIDYQKSNLFFIKSKHVFREYKNHDYFENQKDRDMIQGNSSIEFVQTPTPFGINNAYFYIRDQISKRVKPKEQAHNHRKDSRYTIKKQPNINIKHRRSINLTLPNLSQHTKQSIVFQSQLNIHQLQKSSHLPLQSKIEKDTDLYPTLQKPTQSKSNPKQFFINFTYITKFQTDEQFGKMQLKINIYNYILKTFLKSKLSYNELSSQQFNKIINKIIQIYLQQKNIISYKDIINCKNINQIFNILSLYHQESSEYKEIIRHFFIANQEVYQYQFNCIKDQIRNLVNQETNSIHINSEIYIFRIKNGEFIDNLYQLIKFSNEKFVVGVAQNAYELYRIYFKEKQSKKQAEQRIKKWKSIIPNQAQSQIQFSHMSQQKYQTIFTNVQNKKTSFTRNKKRISMKKQSFIDRQKLIKIQNIFQ